MKGLSILALLFAASGSGPFPLDAAPETTFVEQASQLGLNFRFQNSPTTRKYLIETMGGGAAIFDYDNDGWQDVFFVNGARLKDPQPDGQALDKSPPEFWNRLYRNNRDGTFTDVTEAAGLRGSGYGMGVATGDYDNDGFTDLLVTTYGGALLYRNGGNGAFTDVTAKAQLVTSGWTTGAGFFDYNNDGCLDLLVARYLDWNFEKGAMFCGLSLPNGRAYCHPDEFQPVSNYLFRNNCNGTFTDVSQASGVGAVKGKSLGVAFADYDGDGFTDLYIANDSMPQMLFHNDAGARFTEVATPAGVAFTEEGKTFAGMGTIFADLDDDGLPDILTTALPYEFYAFFRNTGSGRFLYDSIGSRLAVATRPYGGWGIFAFDYDNDSAKDVFIANGHVMDNIEVTQPHLATRQPPLLLKFTAGKFMDISAMAGDVFRKNWAARGAAFGDLDNDGDIDIVVTRYDGPALLLRNEGGNRNHWIALDLRSAAGNRHAIGAQVRLTTTAGRVQHTTVSTAGSYLSAGDARAFFGLGQDTIREIRIRWPGGLDETVAAPKSDQILKLVQPQQTSSTAEKRLAAGYEFARQGKNAEAVEEFRQALAQNPNLTEAHFSLGVLLARQGKSGYDEALRHFLEVLRLNRQDVDAHINISNLFEQQGDFPGAVAEMRKAVDLARDKGDLYVMLGQKQDKARQYAEAAGSFRKAIEIGVSGPRARYGLGLALKHLRQPEKAAPEFEAVLEANPSDAYAQFQLGSVLLESGKPADAATHLEQAVRLDPEMAEAYIELGKAYRLQDRSADAEAAFRKAVELKPDHITALYGLARLSKDKNESGELFTRIKELKKPVSGDGSPMASNAEGLRLMAQDRLDEALAAFRRALALDPGFDIASYNAGVVLAHKGELAQAADAFRSAIRLRPSFREAHLGLGLVLGPPEIPGQKELRAAHMLGELTAQPTDH